MSLSEKKKVFEREERAKEKKESEKRRGEQKWGIRRRRKWRKEEREVKGRKKLMDGYMGTRGLRL